MAQIHAFIRHNLGEAAAHRTSLNKLFRAEGTVTGWFRELRMKQCRRDLAEPLPIHAPAAR